MKLKLKHDIEYTIYCLPEEIPIKGNALASGDDEEDAKAERQIEADLAAGNEWAWCTVRVVARIPGIDLEGDDYLGCCSYASEKDFKRPGGYYGGMCAAARNKLLNKIQAVLEAI